MDNATKPERELTPIGLINTKLATNLERILSPDFAAGSANPNAESQNQPRFECDLCRDTGYVFVKTEYRGRMVDNAKRCECRLKKIRDAKILAMPENYRDVRLSTLAPKPDAHPLQERFIPLLQSNPLGNYVISGDFGTGKTHFFWALYRAALDANRKVWAGTLRALISEFQTAIEKSQAGEGYSLPITAEDFRQNHTPMSLFLDDIDKARPTEYAAEQLFELVDAASSFRHQMVVTTNLPVEALIEHFRRADKEFGRFGGAIVRRLLDGAEEIEMF